MAVVIDMIMFVVILVHVVIVMVASVVAWSSL